LNAEHTDRAEIHRLKKISVYQLDQRHQRSITVIELKRKTHRLSKDVDQKNQRKSARSASSAFRYGHRAKTQNTQIEQRFTEKKSAYISKISVISVLS